MIWKTTLICRNYQLQSASRSILTWFLKKRSAKSTKRGGVKGARGAHCVNYWDTMWAKQLGDICSCIGNNDASSFNRKCKLWRRRFRVPFPVFLDLVDLCKSEF